VSRPVKIKIALAAVALTALMGGCSLPDRPADDGAAAVAPDDLLERGDALARDGDWEGAADAFEQATRDAPDDALAWFKLSDALSELGRRDEAMEATMRAASFPEVAAEAWYNLACLHARAGHGQEALHALDEAFDAGFADFASMREDPDLASLRDDPRFLGIRGYEFHNLVTRDGRTLEYALQLPDGYEPGRVYPVVIGMPPGSQDRSAVEWGMARLWGRQAARRGWVSASPAVVSPGWQTDKGREAMRDLLDALADQVSPEGGRFHLAGCSNGGVSAFHIALAMPERFASLTALPGYPASEADLDRLVALRGLPVRLLVGERDVDWVRKMTQIQRRMEGLDLDATLTVLPGEGHVMTSLLGGGLMDRLAEARAGAPAGD